MYTMRCALRQAKSNQEEARREAAVPQGPDTAHRSRYEVFREMDGCDAVRLPSSGPLPVRAKADGGALHTEQDTRKAVSYSLSAPVCKREAKCNYQNVDTPGRLGGSRVLLVITVLAHAPVSNLVTVSKEGCFVQRHSLGHCSQPQTPSGWTFGLLKGLPGYQCPC